MEKKQVEERRPKHLAHMNTSEMWKKMKETLTPAQIMRLPPNPLVRTDSQAPCTLKDLISRRVDGPNCDLHRDTNYEILGRIVERCTEGE